MFDKKKRPEASVANYFKKLCVKLPGKKFRFLPCFQFLGADIRTPTLLYQYFQ